MAIPESYQIHAVYSPSGKRVARLKSLHDRLFEKMDYVLGTCAAIHDGEACLSEAHAKLLEAKAFLDGEPAKPGDVQQTLLSDEGEVGARNPDGYVDPPFGEGGGHDLPVGDGVSGD